MSDTQSESARRLAEIAERAKKFAVENGWASEDDPVVNDLVNFAASEVSAAVQAEREQACKDICGRCAESDMLPARKMKGGESYPGQWMHERKETPGSLYRCFAWQIHERGSRSEGLGGRDETAG